MSNKDLIYPLDDFVEKYHHKQKINPFVIPTEYVESPIPRSIAYKEKEKWAKLPEEAVPGLTDEILVSENGKVYNKTKGKFINAYTNKDGYKRCKLPIESGSKETDRGIHKLVLMTFDRIPDPANTKLVPNHVDCNPTNNSLSNLEWASCRYNSEHAVMNERNSKLSVNDVKEICEMLESEEYTTKQIAENFNCNDSNIRNIKSGHDWKTVSQKYDIKFTPRFEDDKIKKVCEMLESNQYTDTYIAEVCGVSRPYVHDIRTGRRRSEVSKGYDIDKDKKNTTPDDTVRKICEMIVSGKYSDSYIAKECEVSRTCVYNIATGKNRQDISKEYFTEYKIYTPKNIITDDQIRKVCELLQEKKYTECQIAKMTNISRSYVNNIRNHKYRNDISKDYDF